MHCYKIYLLTGFDFGNIYGKVTRTVSDQGAKRFPTREERLKGQLAFLSAQVCRALKRAGKMYVNNNNKAISLWILKLSTIGDQAVLIFSVACFITMINTQDTNIYIYINYLITKLFVYYVHHICVLCDFFVVVYLQFCPEKYLYWNFAIQFVMLFQ